MAICIHCGAELPDGSTFCNRCGKKQTKRYVKEFVRQGMNTEQFVDSINTWLESDTRIANVKCNFTINGGRGFPISKFNLDVVTLEYELFENENNNVYHIAELSEYILFSSVKGKMGKEIVREWEQEHSDTVVVSYQSGSHTYGQQNLVGGDLGKSKQLQVFILYKQARNQTNNTIPKNPNGRPVASFKKGARKVRILYTVALSVVALWSLFVICMMVFHH